MKNLRLNRITAALLISLMLAYSCQLTGEMLNARGESAGRADESTTMTIRTNYGNIELDLYPDNAPITVENIIKYIDDGFFNGLIFHRVIEDFMIQGGGFYPDMSKKDATYPAIKNEAAVSGLRNLRGTIAMARTSSPDSATSQFYINHKDNPSLDWDYASGDGYGYCVFGKVTSGLSVVDTIAGVDTHTESGYNDVPVEDVIIDMMSSDQDQGNDNGNTGGDDDDNDDDDDGDDDDTNGGNQVNNEDKKPSPPQNLRIKPGDGYVELTWTPPLHNGGSPIYEYSIYRSTTTGRWQQLGYVGLTSTGQWQQLGYAESNTLSYRDENVENGETWSYQVVAVNMFAESDPSNEGKGTPRKASVDSPGFEVIGVLAALTISFMVIMRKRERD